MKYVRWAEAEVMGRLTCEDRPQLSSFDTKQLVLLKAPPSTGQLPVTNSRVSKLVLPATELSHMLTDKVPPTAVVWPRSSL